MPVAQNGAFYDYGYYRILVGNLMLKVEPTRLAVQPAEVAKTVTKPSHCCPRPVIGVATRQLWGIGARAPPPRFSTILQFS